MAFTCILQCHIKVQQLPGAIIVLTLMLPQGAQVQLFAQVDIYAYSATMQQW